MSLSDVLYVRLPTRRSFKTCKERKVRNKKHYKVTNLLLSHYGEKKELMLRAVNNYYEKEELSTILNSFKEIRDRMQLRTS